MPVPTYDKFIEPLLRFLATQQEGAQASKAHERMAETLNLTDSDKLEMLPSGAQAIYKNRAGWAHDRLKRAGLSISPRRGYWKITKEGLDFVHSHQEPFGPELTEKLAMGYIHVKLKPSSLEPVSDVPHVAALAAPTSATVSPDDRLEQALEELRQAAAAELLELLAKVSPTYFETVVLDLLHRMGYGATRADLQQVGGSGDAGIDGVIALDRLGLEKVYVQAKRWQSNIGRPELQAFYGALAGQKAKKGVFITSSEFTSQALDFARSVEGIVLIGGNRLVNLMIEYELGVTSRAVKIPKIDGDYFDEEAT
jgi:restriction system protein